jgi:hypothetical protein
VNVEGSDARPASTGDPVLSAGIEIAMKWGAALGGPEQLKVAFAALEPQLKREHQIRLKQLELQREAAERKAREARERRLHTFRMASLYAGAVISVAMLCAGVYVARNVWWLATLLCGPSLIALVKIFVLRRSDSGDMAAVAAGSQRSTNSVGRS